eukprot:207441_1
MQRRMVTSAPLFYVTNIFLLSIPILIPLIQLLRSQKNTNEEKGFICSSKNIQWILAVLFFSHLLIFTWFTFMAMLIINYSNYNSISWFCPFSLIISAFFYHSAKIYLYLYFIERIHLVFGNTAVNLSKYTLNILRALPIIME